MSKKYMKTNNSLSEKLWYMLCYGASLKSKNIHKYSKMCAESLQEDLVDWIDEYQSKLDDGKWWVRVGDLKKMYKKRGGE